MINLSVNFWNEESVCFLYVQLHGAVIAMIKVLKSNTFMNFNDKFL